ncbi:CLUMA_CG014740, isoform A [Clunio marinus]|uniref:CLUMA_CG014740, isoform A n=1 Tax=Clunio marinus TaxID=568069 RepID=A0A1J1IMM6_9DIPT|nr:CLUMA_CG014740, isoform A [Clunio marinus]
MNVLIKAQIPKTLTNVEPKRKEFLWRREENFSLQQNINFRIFQLYVAMGAVEILRDCIKEALQCLTNRRRKLNERRIFNSNGNVVELFKWLDTEH